MNRQQLRDLIFKVNAESFNAVALHVFHYQFENNPVYRTYCQLTGREQPIGSYLEIPFLPVEFFKSQTIMTGGRTEALVFTSSGTTGQHPGRHFISDVSLYEESMMRAFELFFGNPDDYCFLGLLPSYLERPGSSLVYMLNQLMKQGSNPLNGFFLNDFEMLYQRLLRVEQAKQPALLFGVAYALLDFAASYPMPLSSTRIIETGGMKGRKKEITRVELHHDLKQAFSLHGISSEYGMTELLSQAYAISDGKFVTPPWMRVIAREVNDPFQLLEPGGAGALNIIDLANLDSCCFIATEDLGRCHPGHSFEVLGRMDHSEMRGCSLMYLPDR